MHPGLSVYTKIAKGSDYGCTCSRFTLLNCVLFIKVKQYCMTNSTCRLFAQYLTPTNPIFVAAYIIFLSTGLMLVYFTGKEKKTQFQQVVINSFVDMKDLSMLKALGLAIANLLWPFKRFGIFGCLIGIVYWPLIMPISAVVCVVYCLPLVFLTCRVIRHTFGRRTTTNVTQGVQTFAADKLLKTIEARDINIARRNCYCSLRVHRHILNLLLSITALFTLYSVMLMLAEVIGFVAEVGSTF